MSALGRKQTFGQVQPNRRPQRPVATVVVGGLLTSRLLTLVLLPGLYEWIETRQQ